MSDDLRAQLEQSQAEVEALRAAGYQPGQVVEQNAELKQVLDQLRDGVFSPDDKARFQGIHDALLKWGDHYLLLADYASYVAAQDEVDRLYRQPEEWTRKAILNVAGMGGFSSDRAIGEYAEQIWHATPLDMETPVSRRVGERRLQDGPGAGSK